MKGGKVNHEGESKENDVLYDSQLLVFSQLREEFLLFQHANRLLDVVVVLVHFFFLRLDWMIRCSSFNKNLLSSGENTRSLITVPVSILVGGHLVITFTDHPGIVNHVVIISLVHSRFELGIYLIDRI